MLLYIHIPYCDSKCHYCSFNSYVDKFDTRKQYMFALEKQLKHELERFEVQAKQIETVFIGGGTPSTIDPLLYAPLFECFKPFLKEGAEITTEANPNSATTLWLQGMYDLGVNRISFGVQSFNLEKLKALNRAHSPQQAIDAINHAHEIGFKHLSLDLIYNHQGDNIELLKNDIDQAFKLPIDHLSAYELTIEAKTKFASTPTVRQENDTLAFFVADEIIKHGFKHYEISNFGTFESEHNKGYWELKDYIGVGAGAVGFKGDTRFYPTTDIEAYISNPLAIGKEFINKEELLTEHLFLGLRSNIGVPITLLTEQQQQKADFLVTKEKLIKEGNRYKNNNYFLSDELVLYILD
ncbi:radical SAM family heme chaperone HemW [bacterium]|nr:radical SAM family heme chaperone HemW [bacterium]MBU1957133.1 radical SAM family heme chaperone HemW [bacterium]